MIKQSATIYNYYQSYYLAKAWIEIGLAELGYRGVGFEQTFDDEAFVDANFLCAERCSMTFAISWMSTHLAQQFRATDDEASCEHPFVISGGSSFIVPLFRDPAIYGMHDTFTLPIIYVNLYALLRDVEIQSPDINQDVTRGMLILSWDELAQDGVFFKQLSLSSLDIFLDDFESHAADWIRTPANSNISPYRFFLMISNTSQQAISLCIAAQEPLPTQQYYLKSRWVYDRQKLGLEAIYKQPIPEFLFNAYVR